MERTFILRSCSRIMGTARSQPLGLCSALGRSIGSHKIPWREIQPLKSIKKINSFNNSFLATLKLPFSYNNFNNFSCRKWRKRAPLYHLFLGYSNSIVPGLLDQIHVVTRNMAAVDKQVGVELTTSVEVKKIVNPNRWERSIFFFDKTGDLVAA